MSEDPTTIKEIITWLTEIVRMKQTIDHHEWVRMAQRVNILIGEERERLLDLQQLVNEEKLEQIKAGKTVSYAKIHVEAGNTYREYCKQKGLIEQCQELIRIAKLQARMVNEEIKGY